MLLLLKPGPQLFQYRAGITLSPLADLLHGTAADLFLQPVQPGDLFHRDCGPWIFVHFIQVGEASSGVSPACDRLSLKMKEEITERVITEIIY